MRASGLLHGSFSPSSAQLSTKKPFIYFFSTEKMPKIGVISHVQNRDGNLACQGRPQNGSDLPLGSWSPTGGGGHKHSPRLIHF